MKQNLLKSLLAIMCILYSISLSAYDFVSSGIYYDVVSSDDLICKVVKRDKNSTYKGDLVIPATVKYNNKTYTVIGIDTGAFDACTELTGITIPNTIYSICDDLFDDCI